MSINERIKTLREEKGLNGLKASQALGINATVLHHIEKGRNLPSAEMIIKICNLFNVSVDWLLGLKEERN